jgi:hypothetical protein
LEAFATKPVRTDAGTFDDDTDHTRTFWGVYATGPLRSLEHAGIDLYYLGLDRSWLASSRARPPSFANRWGSALAAAPRPGTTTSRPSTNGADSARARSAPGRLLPTRASR